MIDVVARHDHPTASAACRYVASTALDAAVLTLLEATNVCVVSTLAPDGSIHARAVWVDTDGEHVLLNPSPVAGG